MDKISTVVEQILLEDDEILAFGAQQLINWSSYARRILPQVETALRKKIQIGSIVTALTRLCQNLPATQPKEEIKDVIERLSIHSNLEGVTFERTEESSQQIQKIYQGLFLKSNSFITITQGVNEITLVGEPRYIEKFRLPLSKTNIIYDKKDLVGVSIKFHLKYLEIPKVLFHLHRSIALKKINIIEIISTATELTFIIEKKDLQLALDSLQKKLYS